MDAAQALLPAITLLAAGLLAIMVAKATRLSPIVGFLLAGMVLGQLGIGVEGHGADKHLTSVTHLLAELGVVFLLFDIGLHFSLRDVRNSRRDLLGLAPLQMALCTLGFAIVARAFGVDWMMAVILGLAFALSSTAVVARLLADRGLATCPLGRSTTAVLVFQDIIAIFLLVLAQSLNDGGSSLWMSIGEAALKAVIAAAAALALGRFLVRPAFRLLAAARNEEAFPAAALLIVLSTAAATGAMGLSLTLGAFLAGMIIAESPYKHIIQTEVRPFRSLLMGFFFMSVGMQLDVAAFASPQILAIVVAGAVFLLVFKSALIALAARLAQWSNPGAVQLGALLGQGSEFALVVLAMPAVVGAVDGEARTILVAVIAVTLAATPAWSSLGMRVARKFAADKARTSRVDDLTEARAAAVHTMEDLAARPTLVFGLTASGRMAIDALRAHGLPYIAVENDPDRYAAAEADGYKAVFGNAADMRFIETLGATNARAVVIGQADYEVTRDLTAYVRERFPDLVRVVAVGTPEEKARHAALGLRAHLTTTQPVGLALAIDLLNFLSVDHERVSAWAQETRARLEPEEEPNLEPEAA